MTRLPDDTATSPPPARPSGAGGDASTRAAVYARVSTQEQARGGTSIETQLQRCRAYIEARGWHPTEEYVDEGVSGARESRPALDRLMADAAAGGLDAIVVAKLDRFTRSTRHFGVAVTDLADAGVALASVAESFDSSSPEGRLMRGILAQFAEFERERISERTMEGLEARAREGRWPGGPPPFGYQIVRSEDGRWSTLEPDPEEAETIRLAVEMLIDGGCSALETTHRLNALGRKPPAAARRVDGDGMRWGHRGLAAVLRSERLLGRVVWFQTSKTGREPIELQFDPLIDRTRWEALQAVLAARSGPEKGHRHEYPLSGRLFGSCGQPYVGTYRRDRDRRDYRCNGSSGVRNPGRCDDRWRPRADIVEEAVWREVTAALTRPDVLLQMARDFLERAPQGTADEGQLEALERRVGELESALGARVGELLRAGVDAAAVRRAGQELQDELEAARRHRDQLAGLLAQEQEQDRRLARLHEFADAARERLATMGPKGQKELLALLQVRVEIVRQGSRTDPGAIQLEGVLPQALVDAWEGTWQDSQA